MLIIASIGQNSFSKEALKKIILTGADALRYNFAYWTPEKILEWVKIAQETIDELHADVKILVDMPINKARLGDFDIKVFAVRENEKFIFKSAPYTPDCNEFIPVHTAKLGEQVRPNQTITIGDGEVSIQVINIIDSDNIEAVFLNNGVIRHRKTFNILARLNETAFVESYKNILEIIRDLRVGYIAMSYVNPSVAEKIKQLNLLAGRKAYSKIILKIESPSDLDHLEAICQDNFYDMIMLDRGEISVNMPYEKMGITQIETLKTCKKYNRPFLISTQILESTINNFIPYRSEIMGLTNFFLQGGVGIMLGQETTSGSRLAYPISVAKKIINEVEKYKAQNNS